MGIPKGRRRAVAAVVLLFAIGVTALTGYRVLAPAEVSTVAQTDYPPAVDPAIGVIGRLATAPLVVDDRLRIYATTRQLWADQPVDGRTRNTPYWSYRRWPAQLSGVVAAGATVVSHWSDGRLVALDARTGRVAWQADGPAPDEGYTGRRTGASTVWTPTGLHTATSGDGRTVVAVVGPDALSGIDLADGRQLWRVAVENGCRADVGTTAAGQLVTVDTCATPQVAEFRTVDTGTVTDRWRPSDAASTLAVSPVGCGPARSECQGVRTGDDGAGRGWLVGNGAPVAVAALDPVESTLVDGVVVGPEGGALTGRRAEGGAQLWRRGDLGPARVLAVEPGRAYLLTEKNELVTVDPRSGNEQSRFPMTVGRDGTGWAPGLAYAKDGYVAVERLRRPVDPDADDQSYYLVAEPVVLAAS